MSFQQISSGRGPYDNSFQQANHNRGGQGSFQAVHTGGFQTNGSVRVVHQGSGQSQASSAPGQDPLIKIISEHLLQYQQNISILQKIVQSIGTRQDSDELQDHFRTQLDVVNELTRRIELRLTNLAKDLDHLPRQEAAKRRAAHVKLAKDFQRLRALQDALCAEAGRRKARIAEERAKIEAGLEQGGGGGGGAPGVMERREQELQLKAQRQEQRVNQAIIEETEQEMLQINQKLYQVNEIYRDLATLVADQHEQVEHIEETTEAAHARAKAGLEQVKKAHEAQPVCAVS